MLNRDVFSKDPTTFSIPNDGVTVVSTPRAPEQWEVLRYELESFVCSGEYRSGMDRVLSTFLGHLDQPRQPAVWVSGFYGSGKSHFVRVLQYLWQDAVFPDGAQARGLVVLPDDIRDKLLELTTAGRRAGGLWAAAGNVGAGRDSVRLALLGILFEAAGLPTQFAPAQFVIWLLKNEIYEAVKSGVERSDASLAEELKNMYVSPILAKSVLAAYPDLASTFKDVLGQIRSQFPHKDEINDNEMLQAMEDVLSLQSTRPGAWPVTLLVLDELQQSIGNDSDRTLQVQNVIQACSSRFGSQLLVVATGQAALEASPQLSKLQDRFTVRVMLSDKDVEQVTREVVLRKAPDKTAAVGEVLDSASGEIDRHLAGTRIAPTMADGGDLMPDYPLLPSRRRFWERLLRAIDRPGTAAQLRTQLRIVHEAVRSVANDAVGTVVPADSIYGQQRASMLQSGVLLPEVSTVIAEQDDGTPDGRLRSRLCATIFLIGELPTEGAIATGVVATAETLADLLVQDLPQGSANLRQRIPPLLQAMVDEGLLMVVEGKYSLQTRESAEWERDRRSRYQRIVADETRLASDRATEFRNAVSQALKGIKLVQGVSKTPRKYELHFGLSAPPSGADAVPLWVRDEWSVSEKSVREDAQAAGTESPIVFVLLPRREAEALRQGLANLGAATETLEARPATQTTSEGVEARRAMQSRQELERNNLNSLLASILTGARVFQGGGNELAEGSLQESIEKALDAALVRLFPNYGMADDPRWGTVVQRARQGGADALSAVGHSGSADQHPVCREVLAFIAGAGKAGSEIRKRFTGVGYGWPQDAVDGALLALLVEDRVEAFDKGGQTPSAKEIVQSQIGVVAFRAAAVVPTALHRIGVRKLCADLGLSVKNGEEAQATPRLLQQLSDLADDAGGPAPLPAVPSKAVIDELLGKSGSEQLVAAFDQRSELFERFTTWSHEKELAKTRLPLWQTLQRLLAHAEGRAAADRIRPQVEAVLANRSLLSEPDPVQPLINALCADLRRALQMSRQRLVDAREAELESVKATEEWAKLSDERWHGILARHSLGPVATLDVGTDEKLLATLSETPLKTWDDWAVSMPGHMRAAREEAAKLLEPKAVRVRPKATTLHTVDEVDDYVGALRAEILAHIDAGHPVIL